MEPSHVGCITGVIKWCSFLCCTVLWSMEVTNVLDKGEMVDVLRFAGELRADGIGSYVLVWMENKVANGTLIGIN